MTIEVERVSRDFGSTTALKPTSLKIKNGELVGLLGPSGSGKTTLLRIIAGLETPTTGRVLFSGKDVTALHPRKRRVGFVFQNYALFRHMTVRDNIAFGLRVRGGKNRLSKSNIRERVDTLLAQMKLEPYANRLPAQLSGGQQQRVALARALAVEPEVLLMDEPFGALDAKVRVELRQWLRQLHQEMNFTCIFVTHDQEEALALSDRVAVMSQGQLEQIDSPQALYDSPTNRFVWDFLGPTNTLKGMVSDQRLHLSNDAFVKLPGLSDGPVELLIRPHDLALDKAPSPEAALPVHIHSVVTIGGLMTIDLQPAWEDKLWQVTLPSSEHARSPLVQGEQRYLYPHQLMRVNAEDNSLERVMLGSTVDS